MINIQNCYARIYYYERTLHNNGKSIPKRAIRNKWIITLLNFPI